jgi:pimeloyl-ACP methyl ester carboxylesterase
MNNVVAWRGEDDLLKPNVFRRPGVFVVVSGLGRKKFPKSENLRFRSFSSIRRLEPLRWAADQPRLYGRFGDDGSFYVDARAGDFQTGPALAPNLRQVRLRTRSHGDLSILSDPATTSLLERLFRGGNPVRTAATIGSTASFLHIERGGDFALHLTTAAGTSKLAERANFTRDLMVLDELNPAVAFLGKQDEQQPFLANARPLLDLTTGRQIGRYGVTEILQAGPGKARSDVGHGELSLIKDAVSHSGVVWALVESETRLRILRIRGSRTESFELCRKKGFAGKFIVEDPQLKGIKRTTVRFGDDLRPRSGAMFGQLYMPAQGARDLVVYVHGGPAFTFSQSNLPPVVARLAPMGKAVLVLEYAGSVGGGYELSSRLPRDGIKALEDDMSHLASWVRKGGFGRVSIIGESFGGVPALIAARDYRDVFRDVIFLAALLQRPEADAIVAVQAPGHATSDNQLLSELVYFGGTGGRERFRSDLSTLVNSLSPSPDFHFFFGDQDHVSSIRDLPSAMLKSGTVVSFPQTSHETLAIKTVVWEQIREILSRPPPTGARPDPK